MNIQIHECEHCCALRIRESLHLSGFLFLVHITCLFNVFNSVYSPVIHREKEINEWKFFFRKAPWVSKDTGEITSSVLLGCQAKTPLIFLGRAKGIEKLCSLKLCVALITLICASGVAYQSHKQ